jgi:biopolymer transport protein ExbD
MRFKRPAPGAATGDLTPMIDMTFQLIAFFMVLVNFTEADQNERIKLPTSELVKPPDAPMETPIFLNLTKEGTVIVGAQEWPTIQGVRSQLIVEANIMKRKNKQPRDATVIIRADAGAPAGKVRQLVQVCQEAEFENFALRAEEEVN